MIEHTFFQAPASYQVGGVTEDGTFQVSNKKVAWFSEHRKFSNKYRDGKMAGCLCKLSPDGIDNVLVITFAKGNTSSHFTFQSGFDANLCAQHVLYQLFRHNAMRTIKTDSESAPAVEVSRIVLRSLSADSAELSWNDIESSKSQAYYVKYGSVLTQVHDCKVSLSSLKAGMTQVVEIWREDSTDRVRYWITPLHPISTLTFQAMDETSGILTWQLSAENGSVPCTSKVELSERGEKLHVIATNLNTTDYVLQNLKRGIEYDVRVRCGLRGVYETIGQSVSFLIE